jgi:predicted nucleic acid-binding protein
LAPPSGEDRFLAAIGRQRRLNLDTNVAIYHLGAEPRYAKLVRGLFRLAIEGEAEIIFSAIVQMELMVGPLKQGDFEMAERVLDLTERHPGVMTVDVTGAVVRQAALLCAEGFDFADSLIVATGIATDCDAIVTNDGGWRRALARFGGRRRLSGGGKGLRLPQVVFLDEFVDS